MRFFRVQDTGISFEDMVAYNSEDGGDGNEVGLCVSGRPDGFDGGAAFGGSWDAYGDDDGEVVVLEGTIVAEIYDGYRIRPTAEIARFSKKAWNQMLEDESAWDWE